MPTYQYACRDADCGNQFELVQSFTDPNASQCPECSGPVRKVFSAVGVVFKGSGFYRNDSRAGAGATGKKAESKADSSAAKPSDSSASTSGESKPAASTSTSTSNSTSSSSTASVAAAS